MDPLAHTLVGASLAETRLRRLAPLAAPTFILGANAPDVDAVTMFIGGDFSLGFRRGWTHGVLAMAVLPALVAGVMLLVDRLRRPPAAARAPAGSLLLASAIAVWSHPALDWLNTYGIRFLMPFDGRWFYGDTLFIIDPWVWLLAGSASVVAHTRSRASVTAWIGLAAAITLLMREVAVVPPAALVVWCAGLGAVAALRRWGGAQQRLPAVATVMLLALCGYIVGMCVGSVTARREATAWLAAREVDPIEIMAGPVPANPFVRDVVVVDGNHYHFLEVDWLADPRVRVGGPAIPIGPRGPVTDAALSAPQVQGLRTWMRFPSFDVDETAQGYRVTIRDVRYARIGAVGFGVAAVELDRSLRPVPERAD